MWLVLTADVVSLRKKGSRFFPRNNTNYFRYVASCLLLSASHCRNSYKVDKGWCSKQNVVRTLAPLRKLSFRQVHLTVRSTAAIREDECFLKPTIFEDAFNHEALGKPLRQRQSWVEC